MEASQCSLTPADVLTMSLSEIAMYYSAGREENKASYADAVEHIRKWREKKTIATKARSSIWADEG
jgi:hypothetical protein